MSPCRAEIEDFFTQVDESNNTLQIYLPIEMKVCLTFDGLKKFANDLITQDPKHAEVKVLKDRLVVLNDTDASLAEIFKFNEELAEFDKVLTTLQSWVDGKAAVGGIFQSRQHRPIVHWIAFVGEA